MQIKDIKKVVQIVVKHRQWALAYYEAKSLVRMMSNVATESLVVPYSPIHAHLNVIHGFNSFYPNTRQDKWRKFRPFEMYPEGVNTSRIVYRTAFPCDIWLHGNGSVSQRLARLEEIVKSTSEAMKYDTDAYRKQRFTELVKSGMSIRRAKSQAWYDTGKMIKESK